MEELDGFTVRAWRGDESMPVYECHGCHSGIMGIAEARAHQCATPVTRPPTVRQSLIVDDRGEPFTVIEDPDGGEDDIADDC